METGRGRHAALRRFPREDGLTTGNFRRALADSYFETGQQETADELYQSWLEEARPGDGDGSAGQTATRRSAPTRHRIIRRRKRSCTAATPFLESGKPSTSRDG